jgi:ATP-dependent protease ClpP protease subunit
MSRMKISFEKVDVSCGFEGNRLCFTKCEQDDSDETVFNVSGVIGDSWEGLSSQQMVPEIMSAKGDIRLRLNTPGGFVNDALDVYDALMQHPKKVTGDIVAEAWSAGTILCAACDEVRIAPAAKYGVHRAWGGMLMIGNSEEIQLQQKQMSAYVKSLEKLDIEIARMISKRTGNSLKQVHEWMIGPEGVDGTEFIGKDAVKNGLADSVIEHKEKPPVNIHQLRAAAQRQALELIGKRAGYASLDDWTAKAQ